MNKTVKLRLRAITKGALRYEEVDAEGNTVTFHDPWCLIGTLYLRQGGALTLRKGNEWSKDILVTVDFNT